MKKPATKRGQVVQSEDDEKETPRVEKRKPAEADTVVTTLTQAVHHKKSKKATALAATALAATTAALASATQAATALAAETTTATAAMIDDGTPTPLFEQPRARKLNGKGKIHILLVDDNY
jgi:alpha-beta hydrolase superfamily lysophospholipase